MGGGGEEVGGGGKEEVGVGGEEDVGGGGEEGRGNTLEHMVLWRKTSFLTFDVTDVVNHFESGGF